MDCREARRALLDKRDGLAEEHLAECPACSELFKTAELSRALDGSTTDLGFKMDVDLNRFHENIDASQGRFASLPLMKTAHRSQFVLGVGLIVLLFVALLNPRPDLISYPRSRLVVELLVVFVPVLWLAWLPLRPSFLSRWNGARSTLALLAGVLAPWLIVLLALFAPHDVESSAGTGAELLPKAVACFAYGSVFSVPLALCISLFARRDPRAGLPLALFVGSGVFAALVLVLHCPIPHAEHLALGHASVVVAALALGTYLSKR